MPGKNNMKSWYKAYDCMVNFLLSLPHVFLTSYKGLFQGDINYLYTEVICYWGLGWGSQVIAQYRLWLDLFAVLFMIPPCNKLQGYNVFHLFVSYSYSHNACWLYMEINRLSVQTPLKPLQKISLSFKCRTGI